MKRAILAAMTCCVIAGVAIGADTAPQKKAVTPAKKAVPAATGKSPGHSVATMAVKKRAPAAATGHPSASNPSSKTGGRMATARKYSGHPPSRRSYSAQQLSPTADRYREIQDALAAKGYLKTPPTGVWDKDSVDAMQRFQQDQKLDPTGKLTARSLVALGLGPKTQAESAPPNSSGEALPLQ